MDFEVVFSLGEVTCTTASTRSRNDLNVMRDDLNYLRGGVEIPSYNPRELQHYKYIIYNNNVIIICLLLLLR